MALDWHPRLSEHSSPAPGFSQVESGGVLVSEDVDIVSLVEAAFLMSMLVSRRTCIVLGLSGQKQAPRFLTLLETVF